MDCSIIGVEYSNLAQTYWIVLLHPDPKYTYIIIKKHKIKWKKDKEVAETIDMSKEIWSDPKTHKSQVKTWFTFWIQKLWRILLIIYNV